jgi:hypothetical protein
MAVGDEAFTEVGAEEAGAAGDEDAFDFHGLATLCSLIDRRAVFRKQNGRSKF